MRALWPLSLPLMSGMLLLLRNLLRRSERTYVPIPDLDGSAANEALFDHAIGNGEQRWRQRQPECLGGREIDNQFELGWLLDR